MKKSRKSFLLAMMAILVAAGLAGCGRGNGRCAFNELRSRGSRRADDGGSGGGRPSDDLRSRRIQRADYRGRLRNGERVLRRRR